MQSVIPADVISYLDQVFPHAQAGTSSNIDIQFRPQVSATLRLVDELSPDLITFQGRAYVQYVGCIEALRSAIRSWDSRGPSDNIADRSLGDSIQELRRLLVLLPNEVIPSSVAELAFISDAELRESIREDLRAADQGFSARQWKTTTVMAGAAVEAILLWKLRDSTSSDDAQLAACANSLKLKDTRGNPISANPDDWSLEAYRRVALNLGIIADDASDLTKLAQQYRNLIHPGRARRKGRGCTQSTALIALAALSRLVEDFS